MESQQMSMHNRKMAYLSVVRTHFAAEMQEAVTVSTQITTRVASDDRQRLAVIVIVARRSRLSRRSDVISRR